MSSYKNEKRKKCNKIYMKMRIKEKPKCKKKTIYRGASLVTKKDKASNDTRRPNVYRKANPKI